MRRSSYGRGGVSNSWAMPWRPSTSISSVRRPPAASASAKAAATVVLPVPPLPVRTCGRALDSAGGHPDASTAQGNGHRLRVRMRRRLQLSAMSSPAAPATTWEYLTAPVLIHNTQAILNNFGRDGWELV